MTTEFPLSRVIDKTLDNEICKIFTMMSKEHRIGFTETKPPTKQELQHFIGLIIVENTSIHRLGKISNYFQEHVKIDAKRFDQDLTPYEYWESNPDSSKEEIVQKSKPCTNFCGIILCYLIKIYKSKDILDFSSGWGDRLFASMTDDDKIKSYTGIDPNKKLHSGYRKMIKMLLPKSSHHKYTMINGMAEDSIHTLPKSTTFDLVFTSPPYFDIESYNDDSTQSIKRFPKFEDWYEKFLLKSIFDSIERLRPNGILALNINNTKKYDIINRLITDMRHQYFMNFCGIIYYGNPKCPTYIYQPILIWQKTA